jgi:hypothetical protein
MLELTLAGTIELGKHAPSYDRWIAGMAKIQAKMRESFGKA